ncbi:MAG: hypothetical protein HKN79_09885 [Flavobacteriales bacterium]|nr:hypothetical protein [Flavobacteriales bacterium]
MRFPSLVLCLLVLCFSSQAQLVVHSSESVEHYVSEYLIGGGLSIDNVIFNGSPADQASIQCGSFDSEHSNVGLTHGLILSTGEVAGAIGPNNSPACTAPEAGLGLSGDTDLESLAGPDTHDAAILEFDFVPEGDTLAFRFVFASEEYPEFANTIYNDVFGFFLSGPGIQGDFSSPLNYPDGAVNLAVLPGSEVPISVNSVNNGTADTGPCQNCQFLTVNPISSDPTAIQYDGILTPILVKVPLQCGETYHMKLAIADVGDDHYDSAIFFEKESFQTDVALEASLTSLSPIELPEGVSFEGCSQAEIAISRATWWDNAETISLISQGTAEEGTDYSTLPPSVTFEGAIDQHVLPITLFSDSEEEGVESLSVLLNYSGCAEDQVLELSTLEVWDGPQVLEVNYEATSTDCLSPIEVLVSATGGLGYYSFQWSNGQSGPDITLDNSGPFPHLITSDTCVAPVMTVLEIELNSGEPISASIPEEIVLSCG